MKKSKFEQGDLVIHQQFTRYGTNAKEWAKKCALLLPEIERRQIWRKKRFKSIYEYAAKLAGMNKEKVDDSLWILKKIGDRSALMEVAKEKGLGAVRPVVTIVTQETEKFWAEKAKEMSVRTLETYVRDVREGRLAGDIFAEEIVEVDSAQVGMFNRSEFRHVTTPQPEKVAILMSLDPEVASELEKLNGKGDWNELMKEFIKMRKEKLEEQKPEPVKTESRRVPAKIQRYATEKTRGACAFPGCNRASEHLHHADRFALNKIHDPNRIIPLCSSHHAIAHQGLIENENLDPKFWKIRKEPERASLKFWVDRKVLEHKKAVA